MTNKTRADELVFQQGLATSREQAKRLIIAGKVYIHGERNERVHKPGQTLKPDTAFCLAEQERFVSRGGYKLLGGLEHFGLDTAGMICLDVGASTGGFTDCLLQHGAAKVYAVDVGHAQLHEKLLADSRVISREGINVRLAPPDLIPENVDLITADVSFISLTLVLPPCLVWLRENGLVLALIKPQFEVGPGQTRKGVVRDDALRQEAVRGVTSFVESLGLHSMGVTPATIKGPKGNQEYLACWRKDPITFQL